MKQSAIIILMIIIYSFSFAQDKSKSANIADGYGDLKWGTETSKAKPSIKGKIKFTDEKKVIISNDGEIEYYYGFFYKDPSGEEKAAETDKKQAQPQTQQKDEGRLYYIALKFPYLALEKVKDLMIKKYGQSTGESLKNNQGSISWDSADSVIILWVDRYENNPFCRRITYISKKIAKETNEYQNTIFNKTEIEILNKLNP
jgi:hypothetical protein